MLNKELETLENNDNGEVADAAAVALLAREEFAEADARELVARHGAARVVEQLGVYAAAVARGDQIDSPRGWIRRAIERGYKPHPAAPAARAAVSRGTGAPNVPADTDQRRRDRQCESKLREALDRALDGLTGAQWQELSGRIRERWAELYKSTCPVDPWNRDPARAIARELLFRPGTAEMIEGVVTPAAVLALAIAGGDEDEAHDACDGAGGDESERAGQSLVGSPTE